MNKIFGQIKSKIRKAKSIALFCHVDPDFDALSSMFGLAIALKNMGKNVQMFSHESFSPNHKAILDESLVQIGSFQPKDYDLLISVDTNEKNRLGIYAHDFISHPNTIKLDHHLLAGEEIAKLAYIDVDSPSCAEIVLELLLYLNAKITSEMATILYAGLAADTRSYSNSNVTEKCLEHGLILMKKGADIAKVNNAVSRMDSMTGLKINKIFYKNIEVIDEQIAVSTISYAELKQAKAEKRDCEGLSNQLCRFIGINIACMIIEREPNVYSLSFRSMEGYDARAVAVNFNGGGHKQAAGGQIKSCKDIESAKDKVVKEIKKYLKKRDKGIE